VSDKERLALVEEALRQRDAAVEVLEYIQCALVVPRRSVDRIRRAVSEGRDPEPYVEDIESGIAHAEELIREKLPEAA
jgi:hypothetical protein